MFKLVLLYYMCICIIKLMFFIAVQGGQPVG